MIHREDDRFQGLVGHLKVEKLIILVSQDSTVRFRIQNTSISEV